MWMILPVTDPKPTQEGSLTPSYLAVNQGPQEKEEIFIYFQYIKSQTSTAPTGWVLGHALKYSNFF